jgi:hypothetical protein
VKQHSTLSDDDIKAPLEMNVGCNINRDESGFLGSGAGLCGEWFLTFQRNILPLFSRVKQAGYSRSSYNS